MKKSATVLAFDFGASSGRAIRGTYDPQGLRWEEIHRFENVPVEKDGALRWDFDKLMSEVRLGIKLAGAFDSVGFDTWGVDFGLLDEQGKLLAQPVHYRDGRTDGWALRAEKGLPAAELYRRTGNQIMEINTLFQLLSMREKEPEAFAKAKRLLFMPDLFAYSLCDSAICERSIASTSQMLNPRTGQWDEELLSAFQLPQSLFTAPVASGTVVGMLENGAKVVAVAGHDTQCAIAALPTTGREVAFLSCGTWSLLGTELDEPLLTAESMEAAFSNELGANGRVDYLKNIIGLWLIQESRRTWKRQGQDYSYAQLEQLALACAPKRCFIDPNAPVFGKPGDLPAKVREFCAATGQPEPQSVGEVMRCIYESLALTYRYAMEQLSAMTGRRFRALHVLGGGAKDGLLCRMTADCCGLPVVAGPVEATALGNILLQLISLGVVESVDAGRKLVQKTQRLTTFPPEETEGWDEAYARYRRLLPQK
ncbi:MAG: rhamnulokinase [Eubacteriales bacterium]|nr:rhamnulokinase [Eubacteriales bacterium]